MVCSLRADPEEADDKAELDTRTDPPRGHCCARDADIAAILRTGAPARTCPSTGANEYAEQRPPAWVRTPTGPRPNRPCAPARRCSSAGARPNRPRTPAGTGSSPGAGPSAVTPAHRAGCVGVQNLLAPRLLWGSRWAAAVVALGLVIAAPALARGRTRHSAPPPLHGNGPLAHHTPS